MIRIGLLGAGWFAEAHMAALHRLRDRAEVVLVARRRVGEPFPLAERAGARQVTPEELVASDEVDAVSVCLPNQLHRHYAEAALRAGKHVFCEKPLAMTVTDADAIIDAAKQHERVLTVGHLTRYTPAYAKVADLLETGRLGKPMALYTSRLQLGGNLSWRYDPDVGGGAPFDLSVHDFDLVNAYLGRAAWVTAHGHKHERGAYDHLAAVFAYDNGVAAIVEGSFLLRPPGAFDAQLRVLCEHGRLDVNFNDPNGPVHVLAEGEEEYPAVDEENAKIRGIAQEFEEFFDVIEGQPPRRLRVEDARYAVACAVAAVQAADTGEAVPLT